jgi:hypothetical protein
MDRREGNWYDYDRYDYESDDNTYPRNDEHYHRARNLTNEFEQEYRSHHPGDYDRGRRDDSGYRSHADDRRQGWERNRYSTGSHDRDRRHDWDRGQERSGSIRQGYGISDYEGTSDRYNTLNSDQNRWNDRSDYSRSREGDRGSRFSGGMGDSSIHSDRGVPNYGSRNYQELQGTRLGSSYGISAGNYSGYGSRGTSQAGSSSYYSDRSRNEPDQFDI